MPKQQGVCVGQQVVMGIRVQAEIELYPNPHQTMAQPCLSRVTAWGDRLG